MQSTYHFEVQSSDSGKRLCGRSLDLPTMAPELLDDGWVWERHPVQPRETIGRRAPKTVPAAADDDTSI